MKKSRIRLILIVVILLLLVGGFLVSKYWFNRSDIPAEGTAKSAAPGGGGGGRGKSISVKVSVVEKEQIIEGIHAAAGSLVANEEVDLASEIAGKVVAIYFKEGAQVKKGDILVKVNDDDLQAQLKRYEFQEQNLRKKLERQRILFDKEAISGEMFDQIQTEYNVLQADIEILKVRVERCKIKAPFSGTIGFRSISDGSYIQVGSKIARLVDYHTMKLEFSIPEKYISTPLVGKTIYFTNRFSDDRHMAQIYAMEPRLDEKTRSIILRATYNNTGGKLRPGMSLSVTIPTSDLASAMMIPTEAIIPAMDSKSVWVARNGRAEQTVIETGTRLETKIEVISGLNVGDSVIITGLMQLREGAPISVTN